MTTAVHNANIIKKRTIRLFDENGKVLAGISAGILLNML